MKISIIIPIYNEEGIIEKLLKHLQKEFYNASNCEIIIVDGGSTDSSIKKIQNTNNITIVSSKKGRGVQMNYGADLAKGDILYFLHADSFPPKYFDKLILEKTKQNKLAGCFRMKFDHKHWWLFLAGWFTQFNLKFFRGGDQSLFIDKKLFYQLGKFPTAFSIFEDFELIRKLYLKKEFTVIQKSIISSSRRYKDNGIAKLQYHYWTLYLKKWLGASTEEIFIYYKNNIK